MALIQMNLMTESLMRTVPVTVILPFDKICGENGVVCGERPFKTLYLLHGVFGDHHDWITGTGILRWAEEKNLAVVMPSGENMFYTDIADMGNYYSRFITELVELTRRAFPLSHKREDTFIGGLSMGGYGALLNGLKYSEIFGRIIAFSAVNNLMHPTEDFFYQSVPFMERIFGKTSNALESENNIIWLIKKKKSEGKNSAYIYLACGKDDPFLEQSREMKECLEQNDFSVTYEEEPGAHEWDFWNHEIRRVLEWLPLEGTGPGISSGHIGK